MRIYRQHVKNGNKEFEKEIDQVGDRNEQVPCEMQKDVYCTKQVTSNPNNVHYLNFIILWIEEQPTTYKLLFVTNKKQQIMQLIDG